MVGTGNASEVGQLVDSVCGKWSSTKGRVLLCVQGCLHTRPHCARLACGHQRGHVEPFMWGEIITRGLLGGLVGRLSVYV